MVRHTRSKVPGHFNYRLALSLSIMAFFMPGPCVHFYYIFLSSLKSGYLGPVCLWSVSFFVFFPQRSRSCSVYATRVPGKACSVAFKSQPVATLAQSVTFIVASKSRPAATLVNSVSVMSRRYARLERLVTSSFSWGSE